MSVPQTVQELLSPENCVNSSRIRAFLVLSRIATDDTVRTHLNEIDTSKCDIFFTSTIVPEWNARAQAIRYCSDYAQSLRQEIGATVGDIKDVQQKFDLRLNPYASRDYQEQVEQKSAKIETIENWVQNETTVESILKNQTAETFSQKCQYKDWLQYAIDISK
ncbi:hypothetical protein CANTEDRAFT_112106 [Yamadazyma tenuis ATCC 10573]|uniref:Uncharacterized protein n=1 Tax=Candida tenuis (strain ATCC 10573 / BCRC 21748 / CBS 615 / JCM 9827 / NBRC 10315 / NRRL Y-1498 / VKM Y-70) TaxID=590646 RepID=G3AXF2_CANTC|nr:uncharacterized protein CANTEDRAFT_112106 [Yamadazyma tenuis ATCC 10573]EGV66362.1 hypothetical protein CANTEDRAFT_112106 [Yamadazyma tenuis ATCC 10573]